MIASLARFLAGSQTIRAPHPQRLERFRSVRGLVIVGATCAGKSTIVDAIRSSNLADVPPRFLTRPPRAGDRADESIHVTNEEFEARVSRGEIALRWIRPMEGSREERYGFAPANPRHFTVHSGNNAIWSNPGSVEPPGALEALLLVGVLAPDELREQRLRARSPDLLRARPEEVAHRLADPAASMLPHVDLVIDNDAGKQQQSLEEAVALVRALSMPAGVTMRRRRGRGRARHRQEPRRRR